MATNPERFVGLGMAPALAREIAKAIDDAAASHEITVTLTGDVTGTGSGTDTVEVETTVSA